MPTETDRSARSRIPLSRDRVLRGAVALADEQGIDALTMRNLGQRLGVEAMSLYNHVANKQDVLDGIVDVIVFEIDAAAGEIDAAADWKALVRRRALAAREVMLRHPWAAPVIETRTTMTPTLLRYFDSLLGTLRAGGFSLDLAHHAMHALGSRALGFTQELFVAEDDNVGPDVAAIMVQRMAREYPNISAMIAAISHDEATTLIGCDDQVEFEFGLDLILDGLERLRAAA